MKKLIVLSLAVLMTGVFTIHAADENMVVRTKLAAKLLETMQIGEMMNRSFDMVKDMQGAMTKKMIKNAKDQKLAIKMQGEIMDMMKKELSWDSIKAEFGQLYAETYSAEELGGLIKFYQSPLGKKFIEKQPEMQKKSMLMMQKIVIRIMPKIQAMTRKMQKEIMDAKKIGIKK